MPQPRRCHSLEVTSRLTRWTTDGKLTRVLLDPKHAVAHAYVLGLANPDPKPNPDLNPDPDH